MNCPSSILPDAAAARSGRNGEQQAARPRRRPCERARIRQRLAVAVARNDQLDAGHRQDPGALRAGPGLAEAVVESGVHDAMTDFEIGRAAPGQLKLDCSVRRVALMRRPSAPGRPERGHRPAWAGSERRSSGRRSALRADGQQLRRFAGAARFDQRLARPGRRRGRAEMHSAASAGGQVSRSSAAGANARRTAGRTVRRDRHQRLPRPVRPHSAPAASSASEDIPCKLAVPADREALRGGDPDADAGKAARADPDQDAIGPRPSSSSSSIGTSRSAWPRPITSSRCARQAPDAVEQRGGAGCGRSVDREDHVRSHRSELAT